jgi:hypothetical protein
MPRNLMSFLTELAVSPEKHANYLKNQDEAMKQAGLDADECAALKSGDSAKIYATLSGLSAPIAVLGPPATYSICAVSAETHAAVVGPPATYSICAVPVGFQAALVGPPPTYSVCAVPVGPQTDLVAPQPISHPIRRD